MIPYLVVSLTVISLLLDWFIFRAAILPTRRRGVRRFYITQVVLTDLLAVAALLLYHQATGVENQPYMLAIMWIIFIFMLFLVPKMVYAGFLLIDLLIGWIAGGRLYLFRYPGFVCGAVIFCMMLWGATVGRNHIAVKELTITSDKIPPAFDGYRIVFFADLHIGNLPRNNNLIRTMVEKINQLNPDMVINGGDLINRDARELNPDNLAVLAGIRAKDGIHSVHGNHDLGYYLSPKEMISPSQSFRLLGQHQESIGWRLLVNESEFVRRGGDSIVISGVNFPAHQYHNGIDTGLGGTDLEATYRGIGDSTFNILIAHTPNTWDEALAQGKADLTLSGHVHTMQAKIVIGRWRWSPARWMYKRWSGLYTEGSKNLYVNDGIGYVIYPMRVGSYPELTVITLRRSSR